MDIRPFGWVRYWTGNDPMTIEGHDLDQTNGAWLPVAVEEQGGSHIGIEWEYPRQFSKVVVCFRNPAPKPESVRLQYWVHNWPPNYAGGWTAVDDPYNGRWVTTNGNLHVEEDTWTFTFDPLDITEIDRARDFAVNYRQSYKIRLLFKDGSTPAIGDIQVLSDSIWRKANLKIEFDDNGLTYAGSVEAHNGYVLSVDDADPKSVGIEVLYAETDNHGVNKSVPEPPDRTILTVACRERSFSFLVTDVLAEGVHIPDFGILVREGEAHAEPRLGMSLTLPIYDRILTEPEQSYERASIEIPQLIKTRQDRWGRYVPIGCEANRQEFAVRFNGEVFAHKEELKVRGRDTASLLWPGPEIHFKFPSGDTPDFREREDGTEQSALKGYLPIYTSTWNDGDTRYEMTSFAALISEPPWEEEKKRGDEPVIALSRVKLTNTSNERMASRFWIVIEGPEELAVDGDGFVYATGRMREDNDPYTQQKRWVVEKYPSRRMRAYLDTKGKGEVKAVSCTYPPLEVSGIPNAIAFDMELGPSESHEIDLFIPFITFTGDDGREAVNTLSFDDKLTEMVEYWEAQISAGASINLPEPIINDYVKATIPHIGITVDKDTKTGYYLLPAGTYRYNVCMNEACHQIRSLDYRGHHERAREYLKPFYELQGTRGLHGRFKSQEGVFHGLRVDDETDYQMFNYNLDHGYVMFALCEHYKFTRDREWLKSIAPNLIAACDFITRERQSTMRTDAAGHKVWEYGLIPPGHLEDNPEWLYWYAVNAYCYRGMKAVTEALADIGHPEAERLVRDSAAYREDIRRSMQTSMELSPVMRLADGTYNPFVPTRCHLRGRDIGWIRDSLYGPIHSIECGVLEPDEDMSTWMLKDSEDNVFVSEYRGRKVDLERFWFSQGGNTIQSGLLPMVMVYLKRDQPEHAIRALYNSLAQNLYADVRCFTEHPVEAFGIGAGPFYKTPDECCWINWLRNMLLMEKDDRMLIIAPGAPRKWFEQEFSVEDMATYFGPMSYRIAYEGDKITAVIEPPKRNPPSTLEVRLRHPEKKAMKSVLLNGKLYSDFDAAKEIIRLPGELPKLVELTAEY